MHCPWHLCDYGKKIAQSLPNSQDGVNSISLHQLANDFTIKRETENMVQRMFGILKEEAKKMEYNQNKTKYMVVS